MRERTKVWKDSVGNPDGRLAARGFRAGGLGTAQGSLIALRGSGWEVAEFGL